MNLRASTSGSDHSRHLSLFLQRFGSEASLWTRLEAQLVDLVAALGGQVDHAGIGGAPYFERWLIVTVPSEAARAKMDEGIAQLANTADVRWPVVQGAGDDPPLIALTMSADEYADAMRAPEAIRPTLSCEEIALLDFRNTRVIDAGTRATTAAVPRHRIASIPPMRTDCKDDERGRHAWALSADGAQTPPTDAPAPPRGQIGTMLLPRDLPAQLARRLRGVGL
jgi:hypothetical protein